MKRMKRITALILTILIALSGVTDVLADGVKDFDYEQYLRWVNASRNAAAKGDASEGMLMLGYTSAANVRLMQYSDSKIVKTDESIQSAGTAVVVLETINKIYGKLNLYQIRYNGGVYFVKQEHISLVSDVPACNCGNENSELKSHADSCNRKKYFHQIADLFTADELASVWEGFKADEKEHMLEYLSWTNREKLEELKKQLNTTVTTEVEGMKLTIEGGRNVSVSGDAEIPAEAKELFENKEDHWQFTLDIQADYNPNGVKISIGGLELDNQVEATVYHFFDSAEEIEEAEKRGANILKIGSSSYEVLPAYVDVEKGTVAFTAYTFSTYTVDFHYSGEYGEGVYSILGGSSIRLSELLNAIGYSEHAASEATDVSFSNESLISVEKLENDWKLTSKGAFNTDEELTITFVDGSVFLIHVTDASYTWKFAGDLNFDGVRLDTDVYYYIPRDTYCRFNIDISVYDAPSTALSKHAGLCESITCNNDNVGFYLSSASDRSDLGCFHLQPKGYAGQTSIVTATGWDKLATRSHKKTAKFNFIIHEQRTVTFDYNGNGAESTSASYYTTGSVGAMYYNGKEYTNTISGSLIFPADPSRTGYTFDGWYTAATGGEKVTEFKATDPSRTLYAHWTAIPYTITWKNDDGTVLETKQWGYDSTPSYSYGTPSKTATAQYTYTFAGWSPAVTKVTGNATYVATYTSTTNKYNITWKNWDGTVLKTENLAYGAMPSYSGTPTRAADAKYTYTFSGWSPTVSAVTGTATYTAQYTTAPFNYSISYVANGGTLSGPETQPYNCDTSVVLQAAPTREGYSFAGWKYKTGSEGNNWSNTTYSASQSIGKGKYGYITLEAQWNSAYRYVVNFHGAASDTGMPSNIDSGWVSDSSKILTWNAEPTRNGCKFAGWSYSDGGEIAIPAGTKSISLTGTASNTVTKDLYAVFYPNYTVKHMLQKADGSGYEEKTEDRQVMNGVAGAQTKASAKTYNGFTAQTITQQTIKADGSTVVEVKYNRNQHQVTYSYSGKVPSDASALPSDAIKRYGENVAVAGTPTATGYTFSGWDTDDVTVTSGKFSMPDGNVAFIGSWIAKDDVSYTVKYIEQGTTNEIKTAKVVDNQTFDSEVTETAPAITGFTAVAPTSQKFTLDAYNKVITFYYTRNEYKVTYAYDGKVPAAAPAAPAAATKKFADEVSVASAPSVTGYTFSGWDTDDAEVTSGKFTMPDSDVSFIGSWTAKDDVSYTVKYIEQGTTNEIKTAKVVDNQTFDSEVTETAPAITGFTAVAPTSQKFTLDAYNKVITFYYTRNEYEVTYAYDGKVPTAAPAVPEAVTKKFADEVSVASAPSVTGYTFSGWDTEDAEVTSGKFKMPANDVSFIGSWTAKNDVSYTVKYIEQGTTNEIKTAKVVKDQTFDSEVTEEAAEITGFTAVAPASQKFTLDAYNKVITFYYTRNEYEVTYAYDGKVPSAAPAVPEAATKKFADEVSVASAPSVTGYTFSGWDTEDAEVSSGKFTMPANDVSFIGCWTAKEDVSYTVKYIEQGTTNEIKTAKVVKDQTFDSEVTEEAAEITGFTAVAPTSQTVVLDAYNKVITFYYTRNEYEVTYAYDGKVPSAAPAVPEAATKKFADEVSVASAPSVTGYTFSGWDTDDVEVKSGKFSMPDSDVAFIGSWTAKDDVSYTVKYIEQGTTNEIKTAKVVDNQTFDSEVTETAPAITGFTAVAPASQTFTLDAYNKVITFYYTRNEYEVTYAYDGKVPAAAPAAPEAATKKFADEVSVASAPSVIGYTFSGWDTEDAEVSSGKFSMPDSDVAFIGSWTAKDDVSYTVKYLEQGTDKEIRTAKVVDNQTFDSEVTETAPDITAYKVVEPDSQTITLDAYDKVIIFYYVHSEFTVSYSYVGEVPEGAPDAPEDSKEIATDTVEVADEPTMIGYTFSGWETDDVTVTEGTFIMPSGDVEFYGSWSANKDVSYSVKYIEQGTDLEIEEAKLVENQTFNSEVTEDAPAITGFTAVEPTSQTIMLDEYDKEITFYYTRNQRKLTYVVEGDDPSADKEVDYFFGDEIEDYKPTQQYFDFSGWYTDSDLTLEWTQPETMPDENITVYGKFVRQEAKLVITKSGMKSGENAIFTVTGNGFSMTVVIPGNGGSVTIAGLNVGETYTITESADWSWRYKSTAAKSVQIVLDGENKAEFVNSPTDTQKWLDDESSAHNVLTAGGEQK